MREELISAAGEKREHTGIRESDLSGKRVSGVAFCRV